MCIENIPRYPTIRGGMTLAGTSSSTKKKKKKPIDISWDNYEHKLLVYVSEVRNYRSSSPLYIRNTFSAGAIAPP